MTDNDKLHRSHDIWWIWRHIDCGCIMNDLGFRIRYCQRDNLRRGTHHT